MTDTHTKLYELAADCRVRIGPDLAGARTEGGSGVWIAPGVILTCAHVVPAGIEAKVDVQWREENRAGTVTDCVANPAGSDLWPYPDLAIVRVDNAPKHPCAWLSSATPLHDLVAFGHSAALGEDLRAASVEGRRGGSHDYGTGRFWQFKGNELVPGMSGGPVLDRLSGAVCGVVTVTIGEGADRGGYVVPVDGLRHFGTSRWRELLTAHDRFHGQDCRWTSLRAELPTQPHFPRCPITPEEEVELLALLATFPVAESSELLTLFARCSPDDRLPATVPTALRDVAYALLDSGGVESDHVMPVLRMTHHLVGANLNIHHGLYDWATAVAARRQKLQELKKLRRASTEAGRGSGVISVEIVPGTARTDRFRLTVSVHRGQHDRRPIYQDKEPVHILDEVMQVVCEQIRIGLCLLAGDATVEFVVPMELFDEPFDELVPTRIYTNLGRKYRVVLRDYNRRFDQFMHHEWHQRWQHLQQPSRRIRWLTCTDDLTPDEFSAELAQQPETSIVALTRRPTFNKQTSEMLTVALDSGMPIAVWRRDTCTEHDAKETNDSCSGQRFRTAFAPVLTTSAIETVPETVRLLRNKAAAKQSTQADRDCRGIVLLWDDPGSATQMAAPVLEPQYQPVERLS